MSSCDHPSAPEPGLPDGASLEGPSELELVAQAQARDGEPGGPSVAPPTLAPTKTAEERAGEGWIGPYLPLAPTEAWLRKRADELIPVPWRTKDGQEVGMNGVISGAVQLAQEAADTRERVVRTELACISEFLFPGAFSPRPGDPERSH